MKYFIITFQIIFLCSSLVGQSIDGATIVCPFDTDFYAINDDRCAMKLGVIWSISNGEILGSLGDVINVHWNETDASTGTLSASYICVPSSDPAENFEVDGLTRTVNYRNIQVPFFSDPYVELPLGDNSYFFLYTPDQGPGFTYSWSFPECLPGTDGANVTMVNPDLFGIGEICLTVYNEHCGISVTQCIDITRSCKDFETIINTDDAPAFTSVNIEINTTGDVVTTNPNVEFKAGERINLNPGFIANENFLAHIGECGRAPGSGGCIDSNTSQLVNGIDIDDQLANSDSQSEYEIEKGIKLISKREHIKMKVFPNPTNNNFSISINEFGTGQNYTYEVLTLSGSKLFGGKISNQTTTIDINNLNAGIYLVKVHTDSDISVTRLVKI